VHHAPILRVKPRSLYFFHPQAPHLLQQHLLAHSRWHRQYTLAMRPNARVGQRRGRSDRRADDKLVKGCAKTHPNRHRRRHLLDYPSPRLCVCKGRRQILPTREWGRPRGVYNAFLPPQSRARRGTQTDPRTSGSRPISPHGWDNPRGSHECLPYAFSDRCRDQYPKGNFPVERHPQGSVIRNH
jgi:hypothetical protein